MANHHYAPASNRSALVHGITLDSLEKLADIKSPKDKGMTLLTFLVATVRAKHVELLAVEAELLHVARSRHVDLELASAELTELQRGFQKLKGFEADLAGRSKGGESASESDTGLHARLSEFRSKAQATLDTCTASYATAVAACGDTARYFGETKSGTTKPSELFSRLHVFVQAFVADRS